MYSIYEYLSVQAELKVYISVGLQANTLLQLCHKIVSKKKKKLSNNYYNIINSLNKMLLIP